MQLDVSLPGADMEEGEFLSTLACRRGCGILLDVNNVYVSARNHGCDARGYLDGFLPALLAQLHVAGHSVQTFDGSETVVDTHDQSVCAAVWDPLDAAIV